MIHTRTNLRIPYEYIASQPARGLRGSIPSQGVHPVCPPVHVFHFELSSPAVLGFSRPFFFFRTDALSRFCCHATRRPRKRCLAARTRCGSETNALSSPWTSGLCHQPKTTGLVRYDYCDYSALTVTKRKKKHSPGWDWPPFRPCAPSPPQSAP